MSNKLYLRITALLLAFCSLSFFADGARAACSPGIPCTDYDVYTTPTSGTDAAFNGPKTGEPDPYEDSACDGNFMNQIYARAYMEAQREVIMGQQLIHKPDSVLEYTCFDQFLNQAGTNANSFSEAADTTLHFENRDICIDTAGATATGGPILPGNIPFNNFVGGECIETDQIVVPVTGNEVETAMNLFLYENLQTYINSNFAHTFLGEATTVGNDISGQAAGGTYNCAHMATVWDIAQCIDFGEDDRFRNFEELILADPRSIPASCSPGNDADDSITPGDDSTKLDSTSPVDISSLLESDIAEPCPDPGTANAGVNTGFSNDLLRVANNCDIDDDQRYAYAVFDPMQSYDDLIRGIGVYIPGVEGGDSLVTGIVACSPPIPTGVPIITYEVDAPGEDSNFAGAGTGPGGMQEVDRQAFIQFDHVCPNPGCTYQGVPIPYDPLVAPNDVPQTPGVCIPY